MIPDKSSMEKEFPMIFPAFSGSLAPLAIENRGAPPMPNRFANAVMIVMIGSARPTPDFDFQPAGDKRVK